jgi:hypothetical protein
MAGVKVTVEVDAEKKIPRLRRGTRVTFTRFSRSVGRKVANRHKSLLERDLRFYVPKLPGQRYKRTFAMRRGWKVKVTAPRPGFVVTTSNKVSYTHFVVGQPDLRTRVGGKGQSKIHKGRWWIAGHVIRRHYINIQKDYESDLLDVLEDQAAIKVKRRSQLLR